MLYLFSEQSRASTWRQLWLWLAEGQKSLGLPISDAAIEQMKAHVHLTEEDFEVAAVEEARRRHDVMAMVHAFGQVAPEAAGIIHWGATSCYVTDNTELIFMKKGLEMVLPKLAGVIKKLADFARDYKDMPCLAYTHGQPAQPHTVGKRACLWLNDLLMDLRNWTRAKDDLEFRGVKGTTGTQASFLAIFKGDHLKVEQLDEYVATKAGFSTTCDIACQTYSRHVDLDVANAFSSFGATCQKVCGDIRRLASVREMEEPFGKDQIGSSAMAYKRNPMLSERCTSLARYLANLNKDAADTSASQWLERSLDDSAIRRLYIPEMFLCADSILIILDNVFSGLVVYPAIVKRRLMDELPFMATENIIMALVAKGMSRQEAHEKIRVLSHAAAHEIKVLGKDNNLLDLIKADDFFESILDELPNLLDPLSFVGRAPQQVEKFLSGPVERALEPYKTQLADKTVAEINV